MATVKQKSLPLAIGLNVLLPGVGYLYMGKWLVGIAASLLVIGIYANATLNVIGTTWLMMNAIMATDMFILSKKNKELVDQANTKKCGACAEVIQKEAKICRHCGTKLETA